MTSERSQTQEQAAIGNQPLGFAPRQCKNVDICLSDPDCQLPSRVYAIFIPVDIA
jgi:hypothetical protein